MNKDTKIAASIDLLTNGRNANEKFDFNNCKLISNTADANLRTLFQRTFQNKKYEHIGSLSVPVNLTFSMRMQCQNGFLSTVHRAFANEIPLALAPDHIWTAIAQAVSIHCNENAEELRQVFVDHKGKKKIEVLHNGLVFGNAKSPWHEVFPLFAEKVNDSIKEKSFASAICAEFSTTGATEAIVHKLALLDTVKQYFSYHVSTMCGIPRIYLLGTVEDWQKVRANAELALNTVGMDWWKGELLPVLDHFVALADETVDKERAKVFWERIYCMGGAYGSGVSDYCTGWLLVFFPFRNKEGGNGYERRGRDTTYSFDDLMSAEFWTKENENNGLLGSTNAKSYGLDYDDVPSGASRVPFKWQDLMTTGTTHDMTMCGGFLSAIGQWRGDAIMPVLAWAVAHGDPDVSAQRRYY